MANLCDICIGTHNECGTAYQDIHYADEKHNIIEACTNFTEKEEEEEDTLQLKPLANPYDYFAVDDKRRFELHPSDSRYVPLPDREHFSTKVTVKIDNGTQETAACLRDIIEAALKYKVASIEGKQVGQMSIVNIKFQEVSDE